jgi:diguanylate cyclase (GGDEF)-like protein
MTELATIVLVGPLAVALALVVRHRQRRPHEALAQLDRLQTAIHRLGRSLDDGLDSRATLEVALGIAVDATNAAAGRARLVGTFHATTYEAVPRQPGAAIAEALLAAERAALAGRSVRELHDGWWAIGAPLVARREPRPTPMGAIALCRPDTPFSRDEEDVFEFLAAQTALSLEAIALHERLMQQIVRDDLTGLANHRYFQEALGVRVEESLSAGRPLSVLLVDLDDFRTVNAALGHAAGDEVLRSVGRIVRDHCRMTDVAARFAGQQIAVALPGIDVDGACTVAEEIRSAIAAMEAGDGTLRVTASVGIAELSSRVPSREGLIYAVESALEEAKRAGKNHIAGFRDAWLAG